MEVPSLKGELRALIARYLELYYVSESSKDGIRTENRYQSIRLDDLESAGVRSVRDEFLDRIEFSGRKVLDLGSNLGELSRGARARGAALVDGFEYDPFFVELASAIDAYGQVTRVSHHQRDITDPSIYRDRYDIVLAFSVFVYIEPVLDRIASITDELLVLETHRLEGDNLEEYYVRVVGRHFPHYAILGESDWDVRLGDEGDRRAILAFAKDEPTLLQALHAPEARTAPPNVVRAAVAHRPGTGAPTRRLDVDLTRPPREALQQRFFMMFRFDTLDELFDAVDGMEIDVDALVKSPESKNLGSEGWVYWFLFTKGYLQYAKTGDIAKGNVFYDYLVGHYMEQGHDPSVVWELPQQEMTVERVARRYRDFDWLRQQAAQSPDPPDTNPIRVTLRDVPRDPPLLLYEVGSDAPLPVRYIDGWHRLCSARLSGLSRFPCEAVPENLHDRRIRGAVEQFTFDGARLRLEGWAVDPESMINFELRTGRQILARAAPTSRPDIAEAFPQVSHAGASGFDIDIECLLPADAPIRLDLVVMHEIFPVGVMPLLHVPGMEGGAGAPTLVYQFTRPLVRRRAVEAFGVILECRGDGVALGPALERLVPTATVTTIEAADAGNAPPGSADLVIAHAHLPSLGRDQQLAFLEAVRPVMREGGLLAVTVQGELLRPLIDSAEILDDLEHEGISDRDRAGLGTVQTRDYTLDAYGRHFEVLDHVMGGVGYLYDLVILRKA